MLAGLTKYIHNVDLIYRGKQLLTLEVVLVSMSSLLPAKLDQQAK